MNILSNIFGVARYERIMLMRTTRFRILGLIGIGIPLFMGVVLSIAETQGELDDRAVSLGLSAFIPFYFYTYLQTVLIAFVAGNFRAADELPARASRPRTPSKPCARSATRRARRTRPTTPTELPRCRLLARRSRRVGRVGYAGADGPGARAIRAAAPGGRNPPRRRSHSTRTSEPARGVARVTPPSTPQGRTADSRTLGGAQQGSADASARLGPETLAALRQREPEALQAFYDAYFDRIFGYVRRLVRDEHLAEDLTQEIFMHVHRALPSYDPTRDLRPWVFTIATNKLRDFWNSRRYQESAGRSAPRDLDAEGLEPPSRQPGPREQLEDTERYGAVGLAIRRLPEALRTTLVLRYYHELSFEEIGAICGRTAVAARKRYSRALAELRQRLVDGARAEDDA